VTSYQYTRLVRDQEVRR